MLPEVICPSQLRLHTGHWSCTTQRSMHHPLQQRTLPCTELLLCLHCPPQARREDLVLVSGEHGSSWALLYAAVPLTGNFKWPLASLCQLLQSQVPQLPLWHLASGH